MAVQDSKLKAEKYTEQVFKAHIRMMHMYTLYSGQFSTCT